LNGNQKTAITILKILDATAQNLDAQDLYTSGAGCVFLCISHGGMIFFHQVNITRLNLHHV
jgi:hypothetical protein